MAEPEDRTPSELLCDLLVYAPLGFAFEAPKLLPELAAKGRSQVAAARTVGRYVVQQANERLGPAAGSMLSGFLSSLGLVEQEGEEPTGGAAPASTPPPAGPGEAGEGDGPATEQPADRRVPVARADASGAPATAGATGRAATERDGQRDRSPGGPGSTAGAAQRTQGPASSASVTAPSERAEPTPHVASLGIPEYDSLAASQVVPRLAALAPEELRAVRAYEAAHRGRRTILGRVDQLLARPAPPGA